ncbi:MAG TPA: peptidyl-prolyl cis-trans isomerase [Thermoanaerobaculia bacterium]|nr:peptidyl-prolyl cis-trans isomerase [Thermoanaerobaculia bacterium]
MSTLRRAASLSLLLLAATGLQADVLNSVVLRVNDRIATLYDYQQQRQDAMREVASRNDLSAEDRRRMLAQLPELVFRNLYEQLLLESRADQLGIVVPQQQVDAYIADMRERMQLASDEDLKNALAQSGLTLELLRVQVRENIRLQEVRGREIRPRIQIDEQDLRRYYSANREQFRLPEQLQVREVVVLESSSLSLEERHALADRIRSEVAAGKPFADVIAEPAAQGLTSNVVDFGWISKGDLDPNLEGAIWILHAGTVSTPVEGRGGLHVLEVVDRSESHIPPFGEVAEQIQQREQNRLYREEIPKYLKELEERSLIVADPPAEAAGFRRLLTTAPEGEEFLEPSAAETATQDVPQEPAVAGEPAQHLPPGMLPEAKPITDTPPPTPPPPSAS